MAQVFAPWTDTQIQHLRDWQSAGCVPEFTCGRDHEGNRILEPDREGWYCPSPSCDYRQDWAHDFMTDGETLAASRRMIESLNAGEPVPDE